VASRHKALERGTNGIACEPHEGAGSKVAATFRVNVKKHSQVAATMPAP